MPSQWRLLRAAAYASRQSISAPARSFRAIASSTRWSRAFQAICASVPRAWSAKLSTTVTTSSIRLSIATTSTAGNARYEGLDEGSFMDCLQASITRQAGSHPELSRKQWVTEILYRRWALAGQELNTTLTGE